MPVWRPRGEWLLAAVRSVLEQRDCRLELIVVDDGCPEPVAPLLAGIEDDRMRLVRAEHGGAAGARNAGLAVARGDLVRFVDYDDVCEPDSTALLVRVMGGDDHVISYGATLLCDDALRPTWTMVSSLQGTITHDCLLGRFHVRLPSLLFPRRVTDAVGAWDPSFRLSADWDYVLRALDHARVRGERDVVTYYRRHAASLMGTATIAEGEDEWRRIMTCYFDRHPEQRGTELERQAEAELYLDRGIAYASDRRYGESLDRFRRAAALDPWATAKAAARFVPRHGVWLARRYLGALRHRRRP